jgi:hypothetical protein
VPLNQSRFGFEEVERVVASTAQPSSYIAASSTTASAAASSASSCHVAAPTTTQSGTTPNCCQWYVIQAGDTCDSITGDLDLAAGNIYELNPELLPDCYKLTIGNAYAIPLSRPNPILH